MLEIIRVSAVPSTLNLSSQWILASPAIDQSNLIKIVRSKARIPTQLESLSTLQFPQTSFLPAAQTLLSHPQQTDWHRSWKPLLLVNLSILAMKWWNGFEQERSYERRAESMPKLVRVTFHPCKQADRLIRVYRKSAFRAAPTSEENEEAEEEG